MTELEMKLEHIDFRPTGIPLPDPRHRTQFIEDLCTKSSHARRVLSPAVDTDLTPLNATIVSPDLQMVSAHSAEFASGDLDPRLTLRSHNGRWQIDVSHYDRVYDQDGNLVRSTKQEDGFVEVNPIEGPFVLVACRRDDRDTERVYDVLCNAEWIDRLIASK